ncbi:MAG: VOC family protein [Opitutaceae bacterium]|nr:VOC family protein [Opitutaceae bacterium]
MNTTHPTSSNLEYQNLMAYLTVHDAKAAIAFYTQAFGAIERFRLTAGPDRIGHCELIIEGQVLMLADPMCETAKSAKDLGGSPVKLALLVSDADAAFARAVAAGARPDMEPADQFYGFRMAGFTDPFGFGWMVQHRIETVQPAEMQKRWEEMMRKFAETGNCSGA